MTRKMRPASLAAVLVGAVALSIAGREQAAVAGARPYAFAEGIESLPEASLELESWFGAGEPRAGGPTWDWWLGPVLGVSDQLEVGLFGIFVQRPGTAEDVPSALTLDELRLQASWLLAERGTWPVDVRIRGEIGQPVAGDYYSAWLTAATSVDLDRLNLEADLGSWVKIDPDAPVPYLTYELAASYEVVRGLRLGAEGFGSTAFAATGPQPHLYLGPAAAYGIGRLWLAATAAAGIGGMSQALQGRIVIGLLL